MRDPALAGIAHVRSIRYGGQERDGPRAAETAGGLADTAKDGDDMRTVILRLVRDRVVMVGPSVRELAEEVGASTSTVHAHLRSLERDGLVRNMGRKGYGPT